MKTKIFVIAFLLITSFTFVYFSSTEKAVKPPSPPPQFSQGGWGDKFYIGAMNDDDDYYYREGGHWEQLDRLEFSLWHKYTIGRYDTDIQRWCPALGFVRVQNDLLMKSVSEYKDAVNAEISSIYYQHNGRKLIAMRPKIMWLCFGQSSTYEAEPISWNDPLWFYSFQVNVGDVYEDWEWNEGKKVLHCGMPTGGPNAGIVLSRLKANTEQSRKIVNTGIPEKDQYLNQWEGDSQCDWIIKPRIRILQSFVVPANYETPVCSIKVVAQDGNTVLKETIIKAKYFKVDNGGANYYGEYIEEFNFDDPNVNLTIPGDWAVNENGWQYKARGNRTYEQEQSCTDECNHADIQIFWYDNCDMWIDYVKVENDVADRLLKGNDQEFEGWMHQEIDQIAKPENGPNAILKYYLELAEFNNIPCMAYVNRQLKHYSEEQGDPNVIVDLMQDLTFFITYHVPWNSRTTIENTDFLLEHYINKVGFTQVFAESYPLNACYTTDQGQQIFSKIPKTLPTTSGTNILASVTGASDYDTWLQDNLNRKPSWQEGGEAGSSCPTGTTWLAQFPGTFRNRMQVCNAISKAADIPFIFMPQAHQWFTEYEVHREPTNEELNMMANAAVSYGAKGIMYFEFTTWTDEHGPNYGTGLVTEWAGNLIEENYYGQAPDHGMQFKSEAMHSIAVRVANKWGPYLLSFDNTHTDSYIYDFGMERDRLKSATYINAIFSYVPGYPQIDCQEDHPDFPNPPDMIYECPDSTYVQVATFEPTTPEAYTKYLMIVNRRCSPYIDESNEDSRGGKRHLIMQFYPYAPEFAAYSNWNIFNLEDPLIAPIEFHYPITDPIVLGDFWPGVGRLYKIEPAP